jgi:hypothetical protein
MQNKEEMKAVRMVLFSSEEGSKTLSDSHFPHFSSAGQDYSCEFPGLVRNLLKRRGDSTIGLAHTLNLKLCQTNQHIVHALQNLGRK